MGSRDFRTELQGKKRGARIASLVVLYTHYMTVVGAEGRKGKEGSPRPERVHLKETNPLGEKRKTYRIHEQKQKHAASWLSRREKAPRYKSVKRLVPFPGRRYESSERKSFVTRRWKTTVFAAGSCTRMLTTRRADEEKAEEGIVRLETNPNHLITGGTSLTQV